MTMLNLTQRKRELLIGLALFSLTLALYWPVRHHGFVDYDDNAYLMEEPHVAQGLTWDSLVWAFTERHFFMWHPLTSISLIVDYQLFGLNAGAYHLESAVLHSLSAVLLLLALRLMTGSIWRSAIVAALFAWHPLRVESVAWAAERKDVLCTLFWMLTLIAYAYYARLPNRRRYFILIAAYGLGILTKPMIVTLPCALLLLDVWPLRRISPVAWPQGTEAWQKFWRQLAPLLKEKIPLFLLMVCVSLTTYRAQSAGRLGNVLVSYVKYIQMLVWPAHLALPYPRPASDPLGQVIPAVMVIVGITYFAWRTVRQRPYLFTGWLWYLGVLAPVIGLVHVADVGMADRYTYLPTIGLLIMAVWGIGEWVEHWPAGRALASVGAGAVMIACLATTREQLSYWKNSKTLFAHSLTVMPDNSIATFIVGLALYQEHRVDEAISFYKTGLRLNPNDAKGHLQLGIALMSKGTREESKGLREEAKAHFVRAAQINPTLIAAQFQLGIALAMEQRLDDAVVQFNEVLRREPNNVEVHNNLGNVLYLQQKLPQAVEQYTVSIRLKPQQVEAYSNLGLALETMGHTKEALLAFSKAAESQSHPPAELRFKIGNLQAALGQMAEAVAQYRAVAREQPDWDQAVNELAHALATSSNPRVRNGAEAVKWAKGVCEHTQYHYAVPVDTLAAAYAEAGQFNDAVETAKQAAALARTANNEPLAAQIEERLKLYQAGQPFHEPR